MEGLRSISNDFECSLVVDETSTGCGASGNGFWQYSGDADYVCFGKRTQAAGYFSKDNALNVGGNENDVKLFKIIKQGMDNDNLVQRATDVAAVVESQAKNVGLNGGVTAVRTSGTSIWVETDSAEAQANLVAHMKAHGVLVQKNGAAGGIVARPALIFGKS